MAEAAVVVAITSIATGLAQEALKKGCFLVCGWCCQLRVKFERISDELQMMRAFLRDAERREEAAGDETLKTWIQGVMAAAFEAEDIVEEFSFLFVKQRGQRGRWASLRNALNPAPWLRIADRLSNVESRLSHLNALKDRYDIKISAEGDQQDANGAWKHARDDVRWMREEEVVGIEKSKSELTQWLVDGDNEPGLRLISVWGMGGLGKTTLVSQVYKSHAVMEYFTIRGWVSVSQTYKAEDLLRRIIEDIVREDKVLWEDIRNTIVQMNRHQLTEQLRDLLQEKTFLLVIDDVWDATAWEVIKPATYIDEKCGSRIVFTSRIETVARLAAENHDMHLQPLEDADAWTLFCKNAFIRHPSKSCPPHLELLARKFVDKCQGLPLAIVSLGAMVSMSGENQSQWSRIYDELAWHISHDQSMKALKSILTLSLKEMPQHLRACLLYCSAFPEDFKMKRKRLIRLWVAEGLVTLEGRQNSTMEEVGEDYIYQLVSRCILQVAQTNDFGRIKLIQMHDVVRELIRSIAKEKKFLMIYDRPRAVLMDGDEARRLSIQCEPTSSDDIKSLQEKQTSRLRSFLVLSSNAESWTSSSSLLYSSSWKLLRVLDLEGLPLESLPDAVYDLFNLRHLGLRNTKVTQISNSVRKLANLETLDLDSARVRELPQGVTKLNKLRHLFLTGFEPAGEFFSSMLTVPAPKGIWYLMDLQTLEGIEVDDEMVAHLHNLTQLRSLWILHVRRAHCEHLCSAFNGMPKLHRLSMWAVDSLELEGLSPPEPLERLGLVGQLEGGLLPTWFGSLPNLASLELDSCLLNEDQDPLPVLAKGSPNLAYLGLYSNGYLGRRLCFPAEGFKKLVRMHLSKLSQLERLEIGDGALQGLRDLQLHQCQELKELPQGIQHVPLQQLILADMPGELLKGLQEDPTEVQHIPSILAFIGDDGGHEWVDLRKRILGEGNQPSPAVI